VEKRRVSIPAGQSAVVSVSLDSLRRARSEGVGAARLMGTDAGQTAPIGDGIQSTAVLVSLGTATVLLLSGGLYFTISANGHESDAEGLAKTLSLGATSTCNAETPFGLECDRFHEAQDDERSDRKWAAGSFIGAGVVGTATLAYVLWKVLSDEEQAPAGFTPNVAISPRAASIQLSTEF
jgi:hypothetical protein